MVVVASVMFGVRMPSSSSDLTDEVIVASECRFSYRKDFGTLLRPRSAEFLFDMGIAIVPSAEKLATNRTVVIASRDCWNTNNG